MTPVCWIAGAGDFYAPALTPQKGDFVIAADGGLAHLDRAGVVPGLVLGDFDSLGRVPDGANVLRFPPEKDDTDMMIAVKQGLSRGYTRFGILGGLGGRLGHTLANIQTLMYLSRRGCLGLLLGERETVAAITDGTLRFSAHHSGYISIFCLDAPARGVTITGLKYPLSGAELCSSVPLGVSNEFTGRDAAISVTGGTLVVVWRDGMAEELLRA